MRLKLVSVLAVFMVILAGLAWADEPVVDEPTEEGFVQLSPLISTCLVKGIADYKPNLPPVESPSGIETWETRFSEIKIYANVPDSSSLTGTIGTITLNSNGVSVIATRDQDDNITKEEPFEGEKTFNVKNAGGEWYKPVDANGLTYEFRENAEKTLSGQPFSFDIGGVKVSGKFPRIRPAEEQMKSCAPFVKLKFDDSLEEIIGFEVSFVNPEDTSTPLRRNDKTPYLTGSSAYKIYLESDDTFEFASNMPYEEGEELKETVIFSERLSIKESPSIKMSDFQEIEVSFMYRDDESVIATRDQDDNITKMDQAENAQVSYKWTFYKPEAYLDTEDTRKEVDIDTPEEEDLEKAITAIAKDLGIGEDKIRAAEGGSIFFSTAIFADDRPVASRTSSAIKIEQEGVASGGAAVVGSLTFPLNPKSYGETELPVANNIEELKEMYMVRKSFEKGGDIDLLREFGDKGIFSYSKENGLKLDAILVIIDGRVPSNDTVTTRVFNDRYGVRLSDDKEYLYIYDGDENTIASDPISLTAKEPSSGGGGCNAGFGLFGLLPLAAWVARKRTTA